MTIGHALAPPDTSSESSRTPISSARRSLDLEPIVPASARGARLRAVPRWLRRAVGPLLLLALWQVLSATGVPHAYAAGLRGRFRFQDRRGGRRTRLVRRRGHRRPGRLAAEVPEAAQISFQVASPAALKDAEKAEAIGDLLVRLQRAQSWVFKHPEAWAKVWAKETGLPYEVALDAVKRSSGTRVSVAVDPAAIASEQAIADTFADLNLPAPTERPRHECSSALVPAHRW